MKDKFIITIIMYILFGLTTEVVFTAIGGNLSGSFGWTRMTMMGHVSLWMSFVYALAFPIINKLNDIIAYYTKPMWIQTIVGGCVIAIVEFISGYILNIIFKLNCWHYYQYDLMGQICLQNFIWFTIAIPFVIFLIDKTEWVLYRQDEKLNYGFLHNYWLLITGK